MKVRNSKWQSIKMRKNFCRSSTGVDCISSFFLFYINDLTTDIECNVKLFADDQIFLSNFSDAENPNESAADLIMA